MQRLTAVPFANSFGIKGPRRWAAVGLAGLLNALLIYALVSGLAVRFVEQLPSSIQVDVVKQPPAVRHETPPPPTPELTAPAVPQIPIPRVRVARPEPAPHAITAVAVPKPVVAPPKPAPVAPAPVIAPTPARAIEGTHTIPPYPPIARRLNLEGVVRLHIALDASGAIESVTVARSSGSEILDKTATDWVSRHWRYRPATRDGKPVASSVLADVRFDLLTSR
ncbi:MAG TPA: energy transducer TonB [Rhizomicrobium sp.]|nr:energy transducer TonB [Rhizomicrobium sp.]